MCVCMRAKIDEGSSETRLLWEGWGIGGWDGMGAVYYDTN